MSRSRNIEYNKYSTFHPKCVEVHLQVEEALEEVDQVLEDLLAVSWDHDTYIADSKNICTHIYSLFQKIFK